MSLLGTLYNKCAELFFLKTTLEILFVMNSIKQKIFFKAFSVCMFGFFCFCFQASALDEAGAKAQALAHYTMGLSHDWNDLPDQALLEYEKAVQLDPNNYVIHLKLGVAYARSKKLDKSIEELKKASELNPKDVEAHYLLAIIYSSQSKEDKATGEYEIILKKLSEENPESAEVFALLGQLYYSQGKTQAAIDQFEKILAKNPKNSETLSILGSLYLDLSKRDKAVDCFKKSIEIDPQNDGSLNSLGYLYAEDGKNLNEAASLIQRALEIDPENGAYLDSMGWVYYQKGDYEKARLFLEKSLQFAKDPAIYDHLGDTFLKLNDPTAALHAWEKSLEMEPIQGNVSRKIETLKQKQPKPEASQIHAP